MMCSWRHGLVPFALVNLEINEHHIEVEAVLCETLPMPVLFGIDDPQLQDFIRYAFFEKVNDRDRRCDSMLSQADKISDMVPMALDPGDQKILYIDDHTSETQTQAPINQTDRERIPNRELQGIRMSELDDSLFGVSKT